MKNLIFTLDNVESCEDSYSENSEKYKNRSKYIN
jgi:hypothetical protein